MQTSTSARPQEDDYCTGTRRYRLTNTLFFLIYSQREHEKRRTLFGLPPTVPTVPNLPFQKTGPRKASLPCQLGKSWHATITIAPECSSRILGAHLQYHGNFYLPSSTHISPWCHCYTYCIHSSFGVSHPFYALVAVLTYGTIILHCMYSSSQ